MSLYRWRIPGISLPLISSDSLKYVLKSSMFKLEVTSSNVRLELVKLTSLSNIDNESLIDPSDLSAIKNNEPSSYLIFLGRT